jgi:cyclic 2,3-diphosphoglycerate synthetase
VLRPRPLKDIGGKTVALVTTAPQDAVQTLVSHIEKAHGGRVIAVTTALSDTGGLKKEMASILDTKEKPGVLLTELKAASIQVAVPMALEAGLEVVFCDNVPEAVGDTEPGLEADVSAVAQLAIDRFREGHQEETTDRP